MSESGGVTASSLAITEKKPQRSGGCVGIFFQLFDWNRRFAKKKLFSKKLLPPVQLKHGSKKFGGDEKQPKLRLIADENSGGFPNLSKSNRGCSVYTEKEKKHEMRSPSLVARLMGLDSMPTVAKDKPKKVSSNESSTDKDSKCGSDRGGFESDVPNSAMMGSKQEFRPQKLQKTGLSERLPVTRFGTEALQIKNMLSRSRKHHQRLATPLKSPRNNVSGRNTSRLIGVATKILEPGMQKSRGKYALPCSESSLRSPAVFQDSMTTAPENLEYSGYYTGSSTAHNGTCKNCGHSLEIMDSRHNQEQESLAIPSPVSSFIEACQDSERSMPRVPLYFPQEQNERAQQRSLNSETRQSSGPMHRTQQQNQIFSGRERVPPRARTGSLQSNRVSSAASSINEAKNFVALNRSLSGCNRTRMPIRPESRNFEAERRLYNRRTESISPVRKRRSMNVSRQGESSETCQNGSIQKGGDVVSFTFKSSVKQNACVFGDATGRRFQNKSCSDSTPKEMIHKLEKPTCQDVEVAEGGTTPRKSTAVLLQELISALTAERQFHEDDFVVRFNGKSNIAHPANMHHDTKFQVTPKSAKTQSVYNQDIDHFSPGSVLECSFSNNSCLSSSLDGNSDLLGSATSLATVKCYKPLVSDLANNITEVLTKINFLYGHLRGSKLEYAKEVILNAELVLGNALDKSFSITHFLLEELETLASVLLMRFHVLTGFENTKHRNQLKQFVFDYVLEFLDSKVNRYSKSGFRAWTKLPTCMNTEVLVLEIVEEVKLWMSLAGLSHDDLIVWDMSHSLGKWTDFEIEAFENGAEMDQQILQNLVDEVVFDLCTEP